MKYFIAVLFLVVSTVNASEINDLAGNYTAKAFSKECQIGGESVTEDFNMRIEVQNDFIEVFNQFVNSASWYTSNQIEMAVINIGSQSGQTLNFDTGQIITQIRTRSWDGSELRDEEVYKEGNYQVESFSSYVVLPNGGLHYVSVRDGMHPIECKLEKNILP